MIEIIGVDYGNDDKTMIVEGQYDEAGKLIVMNIYEYLTIEECIRRNGHRHLERAIAYASAGYPDKFYKGSIKKALKQYVKAELFKTPEWMIRAYGHKLNEISKNIANAIIA